MRNNDLIQVLWVENDPMVTNSYPGEAEMFGDLQLTAFPCWEEAEIALESDYDRWQAIILDAKCQYKKGDADKADRFLMNVITRIGKIAARRNRTIPWYVLSGEGEKKIRDLIPDINEWDNTWIKHTNRRFYSKNGKIEYGEGEKKESRYERQLLFERIRTYVHNYNEELQIENDLYPDVFKALDDLDLAGDVGFHLMRLLRPIHFKGVSNEVYNDRYIGLRKALEYIFRHMVKKGILPTNVVLKNKKDQVNLSWSSLFLGADQPEDLKRCKDSDKKFWEKIERLTDAPILPKQLAKWLKEAVFQTGGAAHTSEEKAQTQMNFDEYIRQVGGSPYMLRSLTMGLCDFILWYDNFLRVNPDEEMNAIKFWKERGKTI